MVLRSTIIDVASYLDVIEVKSTLQVEIIGALAQASRVADAIAAREADRIDHDELAELRRVADRLDLAVADARGHTVETWVRDASRRIAAFATK